MNKKNKTQFFDDKRIVIVGLGLMGGSLAAACRKVFKKATIVGVTRNRAALRYVRNKKWIHEGYANFLEGVAGADLIILSTPVDTFAKMLVLMDGHVKPGTLVTDVGSVKGRLIHWVENKKWKNLRFVGAHPMVGSHLHGIQAASERLYEQGFTYVTRTPKTDKKSFREVFSFWRKISPKVVVMSPKEHDQITAEISHLPHAIASILTGTVSSKSLPYAGKGFFDTTRVAQGHPSIWLPIFLDNREALGRTLKQFKVRLSEFEKAVALGDSKKIEEVLSLAQKKRSQLIPNP